MPPLTEQRAADRRTMADALATMLRTAGAAVTEVERYQPRTIRLEVRAPGGGICWPEFDGESCQPNVYVVTWNVAHDAPNRNAIRFAITFGNVNSYHFHKASRVAYGFEQLGAVLAADVAACVSGAAYQPPAESVTP